MESIGTGPPYSLRPYSTLIQSSSGAALGYKTGLHQVEPPRYGNGSLTGPAAYNVMLLSETCARAVHVVCRPSKSVSHAT